jgi:hypothetical protein
MGFFELDRLECIAALEAGAHQTGLAAVVTTTASFAPTTISELARNIVVLLDFQLVLLRYSLVRED